jgi:uncharacterized repeat protein (TIGR01451 family)
MTMSAIESSRYWSTGNRKWLPASMLLMTWMRGFVHMLAVVAIALLCAISPASYAADANCSDYSSNVWFNEYFFGSGGGAPPNFLEIYSTRVDFPARWADWTIDVYESKNVATPYTFTTSSATACTVANKTWLTRIVPGGLRQQNGLVVLKDDLGKYVDAFVFDNTSPPAPWPGDASSSWFPGLDTATGCPALAAALKAQAGSSSTTPKQRNMLVLGNYGNKDMARSPDGGDVWDLTSNTGAGTTFTQCVSNNANFTKTVDNTMPTPGTTVTFTLNLGNTDSGSSLSGVSIVDNLPSGLTFISATASNPSDTVITTNAASGTITWNPVAVAPNTSSKLFIKMQVPANATAGTTYTNKAQTTTMTANQSDAVTITVQSADTPSFAFSVSPASSTTCTPAQFGPQVTITAMSKAGGGGSVLSGYNGTAILTATSANSKWYISSSTPLTGNTVSFTNGVATLYLTDTAAESFTVSAFDFNTYSTVMTGTSGTITFTDNTTALTVTNQDGISPGYGAVAGRPHLLKATMTNCGVTSNISGTYAASMYFVPALYHPVGADAPKVSTASDCSNPVTLTQSTSGVPVNLTFTSGSAFFYLCTTDVGQFAVNVMANNRTGISPNFTVRPFVITATGFSADSATSVTAANTANPKGDSAFTTAGSGFTGTFRAWRWYAGADLNNNGIPDDNVQANNIVSAGPGTTARFSGTTNDAGVIAIAPKMVVPDSNSGTQGTLSPAVATLNSGAASSSLTYTEVGTIQIRGGDSTNTYAVTNYLGATRVNTPILSDLVGRFTPNHFVVSDIKRTPRSDLSACPNISTFTYLGEPFKLDFKLTAKNIAGTTTKNYEGATLALLNPSAATSTLLAVNSMGFGSISGTTLFTDPDHPRMTIGSLTSTNWNDGENTYKAELTIGRIGQPDGPFNVNIGIAPRDTDGVTISPANRDLDANNDGTKERVLIDTHTFRFGRLKLFNTFGPSQASLSMQVQAQYWTGNSWLMNADDKCTRIGATAIQPSNYLDHTGKATTAWTVAPSELSINEGHGSITLTKSADAGAGTVNICVDLGADPDRGTICAATPSNAAYLKGRWPSGTAYDNDPSARASFGIYSSPEARKTVHVRELH